MYACVYMHSIRFCGRVCVLVRVIAFLLLVCVCIFVTNAVCIFSWCWITSALQERKKIAPISIEHGHWL